MTIKTAQTLQRAIEKELANPKHSGRVHGRRGTYTLGCRGPLCRKANRDYGRARLNSLTPLGPYEAPDRDAIMAEYIARINETLPESA